MPILEKIRRFLRKTSAERQVMVRSRLQREIGRLRIQYMPLGTGATFVSYHPDSYFIFRKHPEFGELLPQWLKNNRLNNGGDFARFHSLLLNVKQILGEGISGDFAELGVYLGNSAAVLAHFAAQSKRHLYLFDTFTGFDERDAADDPERVPLFRDTSLKAVRELVGHEETCTYVVGRFPNLISRKVSETNYAFVHIDCDLYEPTKAGFEFFFDRLTPGGVMFVHDYSSGYWEGVKRAVDEFCVARGQAPVLMPDKSGTAVIRKSMQK